MPDILISIIIVTYKNAGCIGNCLDSILKHNDLGESLEIIVVDNSPPNDPTYYLIKEKYPSVILHKNTSNGGFGQGNNIGAKLAKGKYLIFLNPDTEMTEPILQHIYSYLDQNPKIALAGIKQVHPFRGKALSFYFDPEFYIFDDLFGLIIKLLNNLNLFIPSIMFTAGACIIMPKDVFFSVGMFDESYFLYCEEVDLAKRVRKTGYSNAYFKNYSLLHLEGYSNEGSLNYEHLLRSYKHYFHKFNFNFAFFLRYLRFQSKVKISILRMLNKKEAIQKHELIIKVIDKQ